MAGKETDTNMTNSTELLELQLHLEALKMHQERTLPNDIKEKLDKEIEFVENKIKELT